jgi:hypothetical protein
VLAEAQGDDDGRCLQDYDFEADGLLSAAEGVGHRCARVCVGRVGLFHVYNRSLSRLE